MSLIFTRSILLSVSIDKRQNLSFGKQWGAASYFADKDTTYIPHEVFLSQLTKYNIAQNKKLKSKFKNPN